MPRKKSDKPPKPKVKTQRSISVCRASYDAIRAHCDERGISMAAFVEERVNEYLAEANANA